MNFPFITVRQATFRRWIGAGRSLTFSKEMAYGLFQIKLIEDHSGASFLPLMSANGAIGLADPAKFLKIISNLPPFEALTQPEPWFYELVNARMRPEFKTLFRFFSESEEVEAESLTVEITIQLNDITTTFLARVSFELLDVWMSERILYPMTRTFPPELNITFPLIAGRVPMTKLRFQFLKEGDVLIPPDPLISINGEGVFLIGKTEFYFELEPDANNSHQYALTIVEKRGQPVMNPEDTEHPEIDTTLSEAEGELIHTSDANGYSDLQLELSVRCGNVSMTLGELETLDAGSTVIVKNTLPGSALLCHGNQILAKGELVNVNGTLGFQIGSIFSQNRANHA